YLHDPPLRPAPGEVQFLQVRRDLGPGRLDGLDAPALGEGVVKLLLRHPPRPLRAWLLVAEAHQEQLPARLQDRGQALDVGPAVFVAEDVEQAAVDPVVEPLRPVLERQGVQDQEGRRHALVRCLPPGPGPPPSCPRPSSPPGVRGGACPGRGGRLAPVPVRAWRRTPGAAAPGPPALRAAWAWTGRR